MTSNGDQRSVRSQQSSSSPAPRRTDTPSSFQSQGLHHQSSTHGPSLERRPTTRLASYRSAVSNQDHVAPSECSRQETAESARRQAGNLRSQQTEKKPDDRFYVDNDYYALNPWYDQEPVRPLFGLGRPFPRTVRPGMLRGRKTFDDTEDLHHENAQVRRGQSRGGVSHHPEDATSLQAIDEHGQHGPPSELFVVEIDGRPMVVRRAAPHEEDQVLRARGSDGGGPFGDEGEERHSSMDSQMRRRYTSGYQPDLPPLQETASTETTQTEQEKHEIRDREEQALQDYYNNYRNPLARLRARYPEAPAEFLATTIYLFFGIAGNLYSITYPAEKGDFQTMSWAWGIAVMVGIYVGGGISGSHMSPWVSVCFSVYRGFPWKMCAIYIVAQILAGFCAGTLVWFIYRDAILYTDPHLTPDITGKGLYTIPPAYVSTTTAFFNDFVSAALYVCVAFALGDDSNTPPGSGMSALVYGLATYLLCITMGYNGLCLSPARDLGPRFIAWWVGYGSETFTSGWWAYGPIGAGLSGSLVGALIYDVFIFVGGESPVNYSWPRPADVKRRLQPRNWQPDNNKVQDEEA